MAAATRQLLPDWPAEAGVAPIRARPATAAPCATQNPPSPARAEPEPSPAQPGGSAHRPRALGFRAQPRACAALSPVDSSGRLGDHASAPCPSGSLLARDSGRRPSPPASRLPPPQATPGPRPPAATGSQTRASRNDFRFRRVLCVALQAGRGEEEGGSAPEAPRPALPDPRPGS